MGSSRNVSVSDPSSSRQPAKSHQKTSKRPQHKKHPTPTPQSSNALPGVQKIKAALRQTRRLLAKDTLAADVRVATERRLKSLEADLAKAEQARLERTMATRYHKIKFFERQKVVRKLVQAQKQLAAAVEKKERKKLEARVAELRVDLNYILHYPKTKKYISLFPPEVRKGEGTGKEKEREDAEKSETDRQREEIRRWIRRQMDAGALSWEPEVELGKEDRKKGAASGRHAYEEKTRTQDAREVGKSNPPHRKSGVADDEFFAADDDGDEDEGSGGDSGDSGDGASEEDTEMDED